LPVSENGPRSSHMHCAKLLGVELKKRAVDYFRANSEQYAERYVIAAQGDVLWQRHQAILGLLDGMGLHAGSTLLDLGCGPGLLSFDLAARGYRGVALDAAPSMVGLAKREAGARGYSGLWQYQVGDVEALPLRDQCFDAAICAGVIDYLPSDENLLREVSRVLRPGGAFVLAVTNRYGYTISLSSAVDYVKRSPRLLRFASAVRQRVVGGKHGVMSFDFVPRKHRPSAIRTALLQRGLEIAKDRYLQFTVLPAPFCTFLSRFVRAGRGGLEVLDRTPLRVIGSCYLIVARKPC
jgi:ubiquinone/menaquinone biosynthesis C-methylase UbiE